jgi:hypothetical protein
MKTAFTLLAFAALVLAQGDVLPRWYQTPPVTTYITTEVQLKPFILFCRFLSPSPGYNLLYHGVPRHRDADHLGFNCDDYIHDYQHGGASLSDDN